MFVFMNVVKPRYNPNRKWLHISMVLFSLLINRVPQIYIVLLCLGAIIFNFLILPLLSNRSFQYNSSKKTEIGLISYPLVLFILSLIFFETPVYMVIGWSMMAFGDGFAALAGQRIPYWKLPWNHDKTWSGWVAFSFMATAGTLLILSSVPGISWPIFSFHFVGIIFFISLISGFLETQKGFPDDNFGVAFSAALLSFAFLEHEINSLVIPLPDMIGILTCLAIGVLVWITNILDLRGSISGTLIALAAFTGFGWPGIVVLGWFVLGGIGTTKWRKKFLLLPEDEMPRSYVNVWSNGGLAFLISIYCWLQPQYQQVGFIIFSACFASALSDTVSSELGTLYGKKYYSFPGFRVAVQGKDGAISLEGSLFGFCAAALMGLLLIPFTKLIHPAWIVMVSGIIGNLTDSWLGTQYQLAGYMNNHTVNISNTAAAGLCAYFLLGFL
jgi:uncharacterized protein (TIGR00297 family)